ncbi:hypothetical protein PPYR_13650 [Photinus pyralis]|uniref:AAA+ ATPase domain-containing protein n=1 Tax=Photinus pyralis TaxID=7054 RepID=A0A1Y1NHR7_PHOPY|nr:pachytene checkpoint protein 2 homolog [Photinus pyralis]KAB0794030.1 hypothetical protein PPYR_13650 [Photinus pyralis]
MECQSLCVEVVLKFESSDKERIKLACDSFLKSGRFNPGNIISKLQDPFLIDNVECIIIGDHSAFNARAINFSQVAIRWFMYVLDRNGVQVEADSDENGEAINLATVQQLPSAHYYDLWESLVYDTNVKENLLKYAATSMLYADKGVNCNIISCNKVILLHGPPGTGKTSLCKALAHKLSIRLNKRFKRGVLMEINSHSLFSKWFSESGKLVTKMFARIIELLHDPSIIIFVLVDEIESLTHAREKSMSGVDPSDSIRVVNAVLTQLDQIRKHSNVLILTTSNMTAAIDCAFVDRADVKLFIGLPGAEAIYKIYHSCIEELFNAHIIVPRVLLPDSYQQADQVRDLIQYADANTLINISEISVGLSGRALRKVPFLAHALYIDEDTVNIQSFFNAMISAIKHLEDDKKHFT